MTGPERDDAFDLLNDLLAEAGFDASAPQDTSLTRRELDGPAPAGFAQELIWLLDRAAPGNTAYNIAVARRLTGPLDVRALTGALDALVARHEVFRTTFAAGAEGPVQVVHPPQPVTVLHRDVRSLPATERAGAALRLLEERIRVPFDFGRDQLFRATLVQVEDAEHYLLLETNHIVFDGWSGSIILRELGVLYAALHDGRTPELPPVPAIRYRDYAAWERERLQGPRLEELLGYWRQQLADLPASLTLPTDRPREAAPRFEGAQVERMLSREALAGLQQLSKQHDATLYMTLIAAFHAVLHRWSGQEVIVTGSGSAGRHSPEIEQVVGYFANTLVLRSSFADDPTFADHLRRVRATTLGAYDHQDIPLEKLVLELRRDQAGRPAPLFQAVLTMQNVAPVALELPGVTLTPLPVAAGATKFDLTLFPSERPDGLRLTLAYRTDLFEASTAERFLGHVVTLLTAAQAAPDTRISALPLQTAEEVRALRDANATTWNEGPAASIVDLFEAQVARYPERLAVRSGDGRLTYRELDAQAERIAAGLRARGVQPRASVGLCLDRSTGMLAGMLGVLKAGAAYVPLVPGTPPARLAQQIQEAGLRVVVTVAALAGSLPAGLTVLRLDAPEDWTGSVPGTATPRPAPEDPAYVLFTSGSTGVPKGVLVTHANLVHYTRAIARELGLDLSGAGTPWHFGSVSTLGADLGHTAIFPALLSGGALHVLTADVAMDAGRFAGYVSEQPLDLLKITPNHVRALLAGRDGTAVLPRRWLVVGGEACPWDLAQQVQAAGVCRMLNHYGPTETTVGVCTYEVGARPGGPHLSATVPIGQPLANTRAYVLDARGEELPVGLPGELYIGGTGVTLGYLNRPEFTAERFVPDPRAAGARMYRTGDRVRRLASGDIEFLGRADDQVKIRGHRVEPGEVEAILGGLPGVKQAVITTRRGADGEFELLAYVVTTVDAGQLGAALSERVPGHMVPAHWTVLDRLPLTANGKVDRRALPEPVAPDHQADQAPRTPVEHALVTLWSEVLKRDGIGVHANFFALGGHSLLAIRLLGRIAKQFGVRLSLRTLFDAPTIAQLAVALTPTHPMEAPLAAIWSEVLKKPVGRDDDFFALGGHSLLAIRLLARIAKQLGARLPLRTLFDHPTVARLAPLVAPAEGAAPAPTAPPALTPRARTPAAPPTPDGTGSR